MVGIPDLNAGEPKQAAYQQIKKTACAEYTEAARFLRPFVVRNFI
jgi:hypothetical protein